MEYLINICTMFNYSTNAQNRKIYYDGAECMLLLLSDSIDKSDKCLAFLKEWVNDFENIGLKYEIEYAELLRTEKLLTDINRNMKIFYIMAHEIITESVNSSQREKNLSDMIGLKNDTAHNNFEIHNTEWIKTTELISDFLKIPELAPK